MAKVITPALLASMQLGFNTSFQRGFKGYTSIYQTLATIITSTSSEETYGWLGDIPDPVSYTHLTLPTICSV